MLDTKFRAWDRLEKQFIFFKAIEGLIPSKMDKRYFDLNITDIQQFTGRKDINEKEIYYGDIVKAKKQVPEYDNHFDAGKLREYINYITYCDDSCNFGVMGWGSITLNEWDSIEIIGNKFENKEI